MKLFPGITRGMIRIFSILPLAALYPLAHGMYFIIYYLVGYRRKVTYSNIHHAFPGLTVNEIRKIEKKFYRNLCDLVVEFIRIPSLGRETLRARVKFLNPGILDEYYKTGQSVIAIGTHTSNWEWGGLALSLASKHTVLGIYKPLRSTTWNELFKDYRSRYGLVPVAIKSVSRALLQFKDVPVILTLISDQSPAWSEADYFTPFLGREVPVHSGAGKLAVRSGYPVIYFAMRRIKQGYYEVEIIPYGVADDAGRLTQWHTQLLENQIRRSPADWLWSHRRWKHAGRKKEIVT